MRATLLTSTKLSTDSVPAGGASTTETVGVETGVEVGVVVEVVVVEVALVLVGFSCSETSSILGISGLRGSRPVPRLDGRVRDCGPHAEKKRK